MKSKIIKNLISLIAGITTLLISLAVGFCAQLDDYSSDFDNAFPIAYNEIISGKIENIKDVDIFTFSSNENSQVAIFTSSPVNAWINIFDENGDVIRAMSTGNDLSFSGDEIDTLRNKKYYIEISSEYQITDYQFKIISLTDDYGSEISDAHKITLGKNITGNFADTNDIDIFKFNTIKEGIYQIYSEHSNFNVSLLDENNLSIPLNNYCAQLESNKTYYVKIFNDPIFLYNYSYAFQIFGPISDDIGNNIESAKEIVLDQKIDASMDCYNDYDYFKFVALYEGIHIFKYLKTDSLNPSPLTSDTFFISDSSGFDRPYFECINSSAIINLDKGETYYLRISNEDIKNPLYKYSFLVEKPLNDDYGNNYVDAYPLNLNTPIHGKINYCLDNDMFIFTPVESGTYYFKFENNFNHSDDYLDRTTFFIESIFLFDPKITSIGNNIYSVDLIAENEYCIPIQNSYTESSGSYTITASNKLESLLSIKHTIKGYIKTESSTIQKSPLNSGFTISLNGTDLTSVTNENGYFELLNIPSSPIGYKISISKNGYLKRTLSDVVVYKDLILSTTESPIELWAGDLSSPQDDAINMADVIKVATAFNTTKDSLRFMESADYNGDSAISMLDIIIIAKHFNQTSIDYPSYVFLP